MKKVTVIDLFCGAGGLTRGLLNSGLKVTCGIDIDPNCAYAYEKNNHGAKFLRQSITEISTGALKPFFGSAEIRLLAGCAPCQPFSKYSHTRKSQDTKWNLLEEFQRLVSEVEPELVTMENVPQLRTHAVFIKFISELKARGYDIWYKVVSCSDYGLPQRRKRLVLLASKLGNIELIPPTHNKSNYQTVLDAIYHLPKLSAGEVDKYDPLHRCASLSAKNLSRIKHSKPGGNWLDWPKELLANCHRKDSGATYKSVYGRMEWNKPSPTITTQFFGYGNGRFGHPEQNRAISIREAAILQTFPQNYEFFAPNSNLSTRDIATLIGNAVPVKLAEIIGESFKRHLNDLNIAH